MKQQFPSGSERFKPGISREILFFTNTTLSNRELCEMDDPNKSNQRNSPDEQLEKACWSGLVFELLPDIFQKNISDKNFIWEVAKAGHFIRIALGSFPGPIEKEFSVDPGFSLQTSSLDN